MLPANWPRLLFAGAAALFAIAYSVALTVAPTDEPVNAIYWFSASAVLGIIAVASWDEKAKLVKGWSIFAIMLCGSVICTLDFIAVNWVVRKARAPTEGAITQPAKPEIRPNTKNTPQQKRLHVPKTTAVQVPSGLPPATKSAPVSPLMQSPSADELAAAIAKKLAQDRPAAPLPPPKPCRGDELSGCTDSDLVEWGKPLLRALSRITESFERQMDNAKNLQGNKLIKAMDEANSNVADSYRECCADDALKYYKELSLRVAGGQQRQSIFERTNLLMHPIGSPEWKYARQWYWGVSVGVLFHDLEILQLDLKLKKLK